MKGQEPQTPEPAHLPIVPSAIRDAAVSELSRLSDFVNGLSLGHWKDPSAVAGWSIGDVVVHLDLAFGLYSRLLATAASGGGSGSVWRTIGRIGESVMPVASPALNALNSAVPKLLDRALAPEVVKGQFTAGTRKLHERLERIGPGDYTRPMYYVGGPYPLSFFLALMVNEIAIHGWDIESRLRPGAELSHEARAVLPYLYLSGTPFMLHLPKGTVGTVQVLLEDPDAELWWTVADRTSQGTGAATSPDATIRGSSGAFVLALAGRISPDESVRSAAISVEGNEALARSFLTAWKII